MRTFWTIYSACASEAEAPGGLSCADCQDVNRSSNVLVLRRARWLSGRGALVPLPHKLAGRWPAAIRHRSLQVAVVRVGGGGGFVSVRRAPAAASPRPATVLRMFIVDAQLTWRPFAA